MTALQPLNLSVNKPLKRSKFQSWYSDQVSKQVDGGKQPEDIEVDMKLSVMKLLSARWIISAYMTLLEPRLELCVVGLWRQETKLRVTVIQKMMMATLLTPTLVHGTTLYNPMTPCFMTVHY